MTTVLAEDSVTDVKYSVIPYSDIYASELAEIDKVCFSLPWSENAFREIGANPNYDYHIALSEDGKVLGYVGMITVLDSADITNIAVVPSERRNGIARSLLTAIIDSARNKSVISIHLEVRESNEAARHLYESFGFGYDGTRKNFYSKPTENALLMTLDLSER